MTRRILLCLLLGLIGRAAPFATFSIRSRPEVRCESHQPLFAYQASSPFDYRDHEVSTDTSTQGSPATQQRESSTTSESRSQIAMPLIRAIWFNQAAILLFATTVAALLTFATGGDFGVPFLSNGASSVSPLFESVPEIPRMASGVLATLPMIALGRTVEQSDRRDASHVNFSTTNMVISLFGRRKTQEDPTATGTASVLLLAGAIALSTGISEEMVFREYLTKGIASLTHFMPLALVGQASLFALGHVSPKASSGENRIVGSLQFLNALWYSIVFTATGGDIVPCIIAHTLYDMHVLSETWTVINNQMDYTQEAFVSRLEKSEEEAIQRLQDEAGPSLSADTLNFARRFFYAFDYEQKGSLSLPDVQRAVTYAFMKDDIIPPPSQVESVFTKVLQNRKATEDAPSDRMTVSEFLRVLFFLKSRTMAR